MTELVIGASYEVFNTLGYGFLERAYENAMVQELVARGVGVEPQWRADVFYKGSCVGEYVLDLLIEHCLVVELKSARAIDSSHEAQTLNYLAATEYRLALLINFGPRGVEVKRLVK